MNIYCSITYLPIIEAASEQTSADFKALRSTNPDNNADAIYEDFVISQDEFVQCKKQLIGDITNDFLLYFSGNINEFYRDNPKDMFVSFNVAKDVNKCLLESAVASLLKYALLAWWYSSRSQSHYVLYAQKYNAALGNVTELIKPRIVFSNGSYY